MRVGFRPGERGPVLIAGAALLVIAASLILLTWESVRRSQELTMRHMQLTGSVLLRGVESSLLRGMRRMGLGPGGAGEPEPGGRWRRGHGGHSGRPGGEDRLVPDEAGEPGGAPPTLREPLLPSLGAQMLALFDDLVQGGEVRFIMIVDPAGRVMTIGGEQGKAAAADWLPDPGVLAVLRREGAWHGLAVAGGEEVYVVASRARAPFQQLCAMPAEETCPPDALGGPFFLIGLGARDFLGPHREAVRAAVLQTGFTILAATLLFLLSAAVLRRREQGRRLSALREFNLRLIDDMPDGLVTLDAAGIVRAANPAAQLVLGPAAPGGELVGRAWGELPLSRPAAPEGASPRPEWDEYELTGRKLEILTRPIQDMGDLADTSGEGAGTLVLVRDRTAVKALEERLAEAEKLAAVGRLAAGVAHEIRNPLSALRGFAQFFLKRFTGSDPEEEYARTMVREADRLDKVVSDLLYLSRPRRLEAVPVDLGAVADELEALLDLDLKAKGVALVRDVEAQTAMADADALKQALLNLVMNSLAALPAPGQAGGTIRLESRAVNGGVEVAIRDDGRGMTAEERSRALEPFFTTRKTGTGLGLAIVHKLVRDHGGSLEIETAPGRGTCVRMVFPAA